ncbi:MAG: Clp1/GlmU family protein [Nitrososphaera sp.]
MRKSVRMVKGPAKVAVSGKCEVLGCDVSGRIVSVRAGKALPFEPGPRCRLRARLGRGGRMWTADARSAGVSMWRETSETMLSILHARKSLAALVVGETDTGKSTLCAYLANSALAAGIEPCVIDGDIGQGDLAPPSAIGAALVERQVTDLRDLSASLFEFIGSITPSGLENLTSRRLYSLCERSSQLSRLRIVNTDGYVRNGGTAYKSMVAQRLQPDLIICLGKNPELVDALASGPWKILHASSSEEARKSRLERTYRRHDQFLRFVGGRLVSTGLHGITFVYMDHTYPAAELSLPPISQLEPENMRNMFVALGSMDQIAGFGLVADITEERIQILTDVDSFGFVYLSNIRLVGDNIEQITS